MPEKKNFLKNMNIDEVTLCPKGKNAGANISLFKSTQTIEEITKQSFNEVLQEMDLCEELEKMINDIWQVNRALSRSLISIIRDPAITEKKAAMKESLNQFFLVVSSLVDDSTIIKMEGLEDEINISKEEKEAIVNWVEKNIKKEGGSKMSGKELNTDKLDKLEKQIKDLTASLAKSETISKMDDKTKIYYHSLDEDGQGAFLKMDSDTQATAIEKSNEVDETFEAEGRIIRKSVVGEGTFDILKSQQKKIEDNEKIAKEEREARKLSEFTKEAGEIFSNLPGEASVKGKVLKAIKELPKEINEATIAMLKSGDEAVSKAFDEIGANGKVDESSADAKLDKMAKDRATKENIDFSKAYTKVVETPEGKKLYAESLEGK